MQAILDGAAVGALQRAEGENPAIIENNQQLEQEVQVAAGRVLVEMHVTNCVTEQKCITLTEIYYINMFALCCQKYINGIGLHYWNYIALKVLYYCNGITLCYSMVIPFYYVNKITAKQLWYINRISVMTHIMWICCIFDISNLLQYHIWFAPMLFHWSHEHMVHFSFRICCDFFTAWFFCPRPLFIVQFLVCRAIFHVETGCTAVCFYHR